MLLCYLYFLVFGLILVSFLQCKHIAMELSIFKNSAGLFSTKLLFPTSNKVEFFLNATLLLVFRLLCFDSL